MSQIIEKFLGICTGAALIGNDGYVCDTTPGFNPNLQELRTMIGVFLPQSRLLSSGIEFQGIRHMVVKYDGKMAVARTLNSALILVKCGDVIVFAFDERKPSYQPFIEAILKVVEEMH